MDLASHNKKEVTRSLGARVVKPIFILVFISACCYLSVAYLPSFLIDTFICKNYVQETVTSPNGKYKAVIFWRDCGGATTGFTSEVSVLKAEDKLPRQDGNMYIGGYGETFTRVKWITDSHLIIRYKVYEDYLPRLRVDNKDGISIEYKEE